MHTLKGESDGFGGRTGPTIDTISEFSNLKVLQGKSLKIQKGHYKVMNKKLSDMDIIQNSFTWTPSRYREFISHSFEDSSAHRLLSPDQKIKSR